MRAAANEVLEAYLEAVRRGDFAGAHFWRPWVVERLELLKDVDGDTAADFGAYGAESEGD
jgi:hypothetical protein